MTQIAVRRLGSHLSFAIAAIVLAACSRGGDAGNSEYSLAVANQACSSAAKKATGGSTGVLADVVEGLHGMDALPSGWQRNPTECQPSAVPPAAKTCFDASSAKGLDYCDSCNYDTQCSGPGGSCVPNAPDHSSATPILGCGGVQADLTLRFPCLDSSDVVHVPLCNRGHDTVKGLVWIGVYSGVSNIPTCAQADATADKGQVSFDTTAIGGLQPGQCVDVHFSRTNTQVDGNISNKLGWSTSSLPNGTPPRALAVNFNAAAHECNFCNNWTVFNADQCGALGGAGTPSGSAGGNAGTGGAPAQTDGTGGNAVAAAGAPAQIDGTGGSEVTTGGAPAQTDAAGGRPSDSGSGTAGGGVASGDPSTPTAAGDAGTGDPAPTDVVTAVVGVTEPNGQPVSLNQDDTTVSVETRSPGGDWKPVENVVTGFDSKAPIDVVVVADNSGSEYKHIATMRTAIHQFASSVLARDPLNRVGLVRVSTTARVLLPLTEDVDSLVPVLDRLASRKGWTALYDGIALGNQTLEAGAVRQLNQGTFCYAGPYRSIVVFTDGEENNSLGEHLYVDNATGNTTISRLSGLGVDGMRTALYTVGIGKDIDEPRLSALAANSGGRYVHVADYEALTDALINAAAQLDALLPVCFSPSACTDTDARVTVVVRRPEGDRTTEQTVQLPALCGQ